MNSLQRIISLPQKGGPNGTVPDEISTSLATRLTAVIQLKSNDRRKINNSVAFRYLCFVFLISRQNSAPGSSAFSYLRNRAEFSHMNPRRNSSR